VEKLSNLFSGLITHMVGVMLFVFIPICIIANLGKIRTITGNLLDRCKDRFPSATKYVIGPAIWVILWLILTPIFVWSGFVIYCMPIRLSPKAWLR